MATTRTIEDGWRASKARGNNFDALRLGAAFAVIVSHSFEIVGGAPEAEPLRVLTAGDASIGRLAVMIFFVLSGFLLTRSFLSEPSLGAFARKRALRIAPALLAVVLVSVFIIGPVATTLALPDYFAAGETWRYLANLGFYTGFDRLPGVFASAPIAGVVNGPLWTLKIEVLCYLTLAAVGAARLLSVRNVAAMIVTFYVGAALVGDGPHDGALYYVDQYTDLARSFFAGALLALAAGRIVLSPAAAVIACAGLALAAPAGLLSTVFPLFGGYLVLWIGFADLGPMRRAGRFGDFSYGLYLWGWPAQQIIQTTIAPSHWLLNIALATPLALGAAILSWRLVERPALALKASGAAPLNFRKPGMASLKALPGRAEAAIRGRNHD